MANYFRKGKSLYSSTTNSFGSGEGETITPASVSGLPTDTEMVLTFDRNVSGKLERILGTISGSNFVISTGGRGYDGTSDTSHTSPTVEYIPNGADMNAVVDGLLIAHDQTGIHKTGTVLTSPKVITGINDTNNNELIKVTATGSAVNELTVANAATGNGPTLSATGSDTDIDINITPKGAGEVSVASGDLKIATGANIQVNNADPKRGIYVPASAMFPSTTAPCASLAQVESTTNDVNIKVLDFDGAGTAKEYAEFGIPSPSYWDASTVTATFYWYATAGSGTVNWEIQGLALADDDALDTAYGTLQEVTDTLLATGDVHVSAETSAVTIAGTPTAGDWVQFKVARDPANDTNTSDARLMGVRIRFGIAKYDDQ